MGHGKLRWIANMLALWTNKVLYFQLKEYVTMDLTLQIIIAPNQLNVLLYFLCLPRAVTVLLVSRLCPRMNMLPVRLMAVV